MLVGDPNKRTADTKLKMQNCYRCYTGPNFGGDTAAPCADGKYDFSLLHRKQHNVLTAMQARHHEPAKGCVQGRNPLQHPLPHVRLHPG